MNTFHGFWIVLHNIFASFRFIFIVVCCLSHILRKATPIAFHLNSLCGDLLRTGASFILLKAINDVSSFKLKFALPFVTFR